MKKFYTIIVSVFLLYLSAFAQLEFSDTYLDLKKSTEYIWKPSKGVFNSSILDSIITQYITSENIPGATGLIFNKNGDVAWSGNYGYRNIEQQLPVEDSTLFFMGSISKTFVATAIMQLWENGLIDLDGNINDYLPPGFTVTNPFYPNDTITVKMLMTHSSSLRDNWTILWQLWGCGDYPVSVDSFLVNYFTPGGRYYGLGNFYGYFPGWTYNYSNAGSCLLALMVKHLTGKNFDVYTRDSILTPLEMNSTSWFLTGADTTNIAIPYSYNPPQPNCHMGIAYWPIGQLRTNKFELANFVLAYLNNGSFNYYQILDSSTISLIFSDHLGDPLPWGGEQGLLWYSDPGLASTPWGHEGGWIGCQTAMYLSREENWGVLFFINWANSGSYSPGFYPTLIQIVDYANLITDAVEDIPQLIKFNLDQNYPNPFNPSTKIKYSVTQSSNVVIKVFDVLGNKIETLVSEEKTAGTYELTWNAANLPSGVYFYQLSAGDYLETKKMVLIR